MREESEALLRHARERLAAARDLLRLGRWDDAVNRAYYAMFSSARALLSAKGVSAKTHSGVLAQLGRLYVRNGQMSAELVGDLREARDRREDADYGVAFSATPEEAERIVGSAHEFIEAAEKLLAG